jgi:hypothetical protein
MKIFTLRAVTPFAVSLTLFCAALTSGCTQKTSPGTETQSSKPNSTPQGVHPALQFDYKNTSELLIAKADPRTGDRWAARILRDGIPSPENEELWTIQMGPDSLGAGDRKAHGGFILHILDTIRTLQVKEAQVSGSPETFGLASPLFILRWRVSESRTGGAPSPSGQQSVRAQVFKEYEMRLGGPVKNDDGQFQGLYASFGGVPGKVFIVQGALLQMLDRVTSFQALRLPTVMTISSDDVDEFEVLRPSQPKFYAQRENGGWTDAKHHVLQKDIDALLDQLTHLRVLRFIDDAAEMKKTESLLVRSSSHTLHTFTFKDRHGNPTTLKLYPISGGKVFATFSTRKRQISAGSKNDLKPALTIFEVYPEIAESLKQF